MASGGHNAQQLAVTTVIVEAGRGEVDPLNTVLGDVLVVQLKAPRVLPVIALHRLLEAVLAAAADSRDEEDVRLRGGEDPLTVGARIEIRNRVT